jgi:anti-sigma factor ChrR (cupin superfamily)
VTLNDDMSARAALRTASMPWEPLTDGVEIKTLERAPARLTALLRLAPAGTFELAAAFGACRDVLVLEGALDDARGHHPRGRYLHHSARAGWRCSSHDGALFFLKLRPSHDTTPVAIDVDRVPWDRGSTTAGLWLRELHTDADARVVLLRFDPGTRVASHRHDRGEEFFVLEGELADDSATYPLHTWVRQPAGSMHSVSTREGSVLFTTAHHLP